MLAHINFHVVANSHPSDFPLDIFVDIDGRENSCCGRRSWRRECHAEEPDACMLHFQFNHSNLPLDGIQGLLEGAGTAAGFTAVSPARAFGGPGPFSLARDDLLGKAGADAAKRAITDGVNNVIKQHIPELQAAVNDALAKQIPPASCRRTTSRIRC